MVCQRPNPFPESIYENVVYRPRLHRKYTKSELDSIVEDTLRKAALWDEVKNKPKSPALDLLGGQQQRFYIARVLVVDSEVILMDEPASALDPVSTQKIEDLMDELKENKDDWTTYNTVISDPTVVVSINAGPARFRLKSLGSLPDIIRSSSHEWEGK